ncbi:TetR/AcrR family transcriptional regulator [Cohnella nanjingensis]|uniref:Helix-turn-helix transcriptional regulator n=1 Tax=Cohnella nanjingensis TaxID=1387779 RepID=A0A7X0RL56_9BACL|nr:helix-turn-helix domain-containing protein [Cohnella nanjingensis]MBB6669498.1 helix-turn-helix transcriptional regulator [Cohnella nanjingensis]
MSLLKQRIMASAMRFFSEKGYMSTSMQDIANDCGIAKGSLYKYFASKEDLLIEVYDARVRDMYDKAEAIQADQTLQPRMRLIRGTLLQLQYFAELNFSIEEYQDLPMQENGKFIPFCHRLRARQLNYYKECLISAYGQQLEGHVWDVIAVYLGMMKEITQFTNVMNQPLDLEDAAVFIVDRMDDIAAGVVKKESPNLLKSSVITEYVQSGLRGATVTAAEQRRYLFETLTSAIEELTVQNTRKEELNGAVQLLQEEVQKDRPKRILIDILLGHLRSQHELISIIGQIGKLVAKEAVELRSPASQNR